MASSFGRVFGYVAQDIKFILFAADASQSAQQVIGVENCEAARAFGQRGQNLLVGGSGLREWRHDGAWLVVRRIEIVSAGIIHAAGTSARGAAAGLATGSTRVTARAATFSAGATGSASAATPTASPTGATSSACAASSAAAAGSA